MQGCHSQNLNLQLHTIHRKGGVVMLPHHLLYVQLTVSLGKTIHGWNIVVCTKASMETDATNNTAILRNSLYVRKPFIDLIVKRSPARSFPFRSRQPTTSPFLPFPCQDLYIQLLAYMLYHFKCSIRQYSIVNHKRFQATKMSLKCNFMAQSVECPLKQRK